MTAAKAALNFLLLVATLLGGQQSFVSSAPIVRSPIQDVELLDRDSADGDVIIQGSMITPFPPAATGAANEPNFFWSGSGDDPDAGMTYWITTTVVKTTLVTLSPPPTTTTSTTTTVRVEPTPVLRIPTDEPVVDWPREANLPEFWLRTIFRTDHSDEQSPNFRHLLQSGLKRLYANSDVRLVNITRDQSSNDGQTVQVVYALLSPESRQIVEPQAAVSTLRAMTNVNVTRQLCHATDGPAQRQQDVLCQSIVTRAEPFAIVTASASSTQATTYWIIGAGLAAAVILILLIVVLICFVQRQKQLQQQQQQKMKNTKEDRATSPALALVSSRSNPSGDSRVIKESSNLKSADKIMKFSGLQRVEEDPEPLVRKARSTSKKKHHATVAGRKNSSKKKARPLTAPAGHNSSRQSCSSLSAVASGSSSLASSVDYRLPREEPVQVSRGARRLKHKSKTRTNHHHHLISNNNNNNDSLKSHEQSPRRPVPKPRRLLPAVETETQEITADFSLTPDEESIDDDSTPIADPPQPQYRWRPGSLIPSRVSGAIFSSRKVSSAPGNVRQNSGEPLPRRAWVSSSPLMTTSIAIDNNKSSSSSRNINDLSPANKLPLSSTVIKPPPLHIHSISFPGLGIGDTDPATELIRSIKQELKKFDHQVH